MTDTFVPIAAAIALGSGLLSFAQAMIGSRFGTDSATHLFMIGQVRKHGGLFTRVPDLLNEAACGAFPIYLHACLSVLPPRALQLAPYLINPITNVLHVALFAAISATFARVTGLNNDFAIVATALFAFCPQFYHAFSARNFGFSSRSLGLLFLTVFFAGHATVVLGVVPAPYGWLAMIAASYLIFAFNTFGAQVLVIVGLLLVPIRMDISHLIAITGGLTVFIAVHPRYSICYLRDTLLFIRDYARDMAPLYILARRFSVWRDWVWDIPRRFRDGAITGFHYFYENPLVVGIALNPLVIAVLASFFAPVAQRSPASEFASSLAIAGMAAMLLISFRATRFLGEPERYVEATTPWIVLAGSEWLWTRFGASGAWGVAAGCVVLALVQLGLSEFLARRLTKTRETMPLVVNAISAALPDVEVRLVSNNEQLTKVLLPNPWKFSFFMAVGKPYCGMNATEAFTLFPTLRKDACERIVRSYRINIAVLQKAQFDSIFDGERVSGLRSMTTILDTADIRVLQLGWDDAAMSARPEPA